LYCTETSTNNTTTVDNTQWLQHVSSKQEYDIQTAFKRQPVKYCQNSLMILIAKWCTKYRCSTNSLYL